MIPKEQDHRLRPKVSAPATLAFLNQGLQGSAMKSVRRSSGWTNLPRPIMDKLLSHSTLERRFDRQQPSCHLGRCHSSVHLLRVAFFKLQKHPNSKRVALRRHQRRLAARVAVDARASICIATRIDNRSVCLPQPRWTGTRFGFLPQVQIKPRSNLSRFRQNCP